MTTDAHGTADGGEDSSHPAGIVRGQPLSAPGYLVAQVTSQDVAAALTAPAGNEVVSASDPITYPQVVPVPLPPESRPAKLWRQEPREHEPPRNLWDLVDRLWVSMDWSGVGQFAVVALALCIGVAVILGGLGFLVHFMVGRPSWLSTVLVAAAGSGASGGTYAYIRRRKGKLENQSGQDTSGDADRT